MRYRTLTLALLFVMASANAQLYKWVGSDGAVSYSDTPPPKTATNVERKSYGGSGGVSTADMPYELAQATKSYPVTLYTMGNCSTCDLGRKLLNDRGIPFSEKTVVSNDDVLQLIKVSGGNQLPVLVVGHNKLKNFDPGAWSDSLTAAGYPATSKLPKSYSNPAPEPAAPKVVAASKSEGKGTNQPTSEKQDVAPPLPPGNAPPGFHF